MEILSLILLTLSLTAAQHNHQNSRFRNPGFRNVRTPLVTSATRDRPFISIPIVLLPDGQALPKPKHATYHYVGHATNNSPRQNNHKNNKPRGPLSGKSTVSSPVAIPLSSPPPKKSMKPPKLTASQLSSHLRNSQSNFQKQRGHGNSQLNQPQKPPHQTFEQTQQMHQMQYMKQQRNPTFQQQNLQSQQASSNYKQNIANFVNFATNLGATIVSQQQNQPVILPTQSPASGLTFQNQPNLKIQESFLNQKSLLSNHKMNNGVVFQHQVPTLQNTQVHYAQVLPNNLANHNNNGYAAHQQIPHQLQTGSQLQEQQDQSQQQTQTTTSPENQYISASRIRSNVQPPQGAELHNNVQYSVNQANVFQQNNANNLRTQNSQGNVLLLGNFNNQLQQNNQQNFATSTTPQQPTPAPQVVTSYDTQTLPKNVLSVQQSQQQQPSGSEYTLNPHTIQTSYINQNQANQQNYNLNAQGQVNFPSNSQSPSDNYPSTQVTQTNTLSLQNAQANIGQINEPLTYLQYQTAQELPLNYASLFNQGQTGFISSSQNVQQNDPAVPAVDQSYTILPSSQSVFASSSIPTIYVSPQQESSSSNSSPSDVGVSTYESYSNDQTDYASSSNQANQASYIGPQNLEKGFNFLQNTDESQTSQSSESQLSQTTSSIGNGAATYSSSSPKQINYAQSQSSFSTTPQQYGSSGAQSQSSFSAVPQQYGSSSAQSQTSFSSTPQQYSSSNYQSSPTYVSFSTANSNFKSESQAPLNYGQRAVNVVTPGTTYTKTNQNNVKQPETSETTEESEDSEYDEGEETDDEEASYKVVYIPLDILKNILSNSVENQ